MPANANYCITSSGSESIDFNGQSIPIGSYITATAPGTDVFSCFNTIDVTQPGSSFTATTNTYSSCYDCLINNYTLVTLSPCDSTSTLNPQFDLSQFGFIPTVGDIFYLQITNVGGPEEGTYTACFEFNGSIEQLDEASYNLKINEYFTIDRIIFSNFSTCTECLYGFSSNTESLICSICPSGETQSGPHPQWTNEYGITVTQMNAYTLGGPNGLNN